VARTDLLARANDLRAHRTPFVFATVVRVERPTSAKAGDCALVLPDGTIEGFVGGACAESTVRLHGLRQLAAGRSTLLRISPESSAREAELSGDEPDGLVTVGNPCLSGGTLEIFLEVMSPPMLVHVFGDSPVARAVTVMGQAMGWDVRPTTPQAPILSDAAAVVVASHGADEECVLTGALRAGVPYVGLVASRRRGSAVVSSLDLTPVQRARLHTPAGLDIAARGPNEIAISILAEIIAGRPAGGTAAAQAAAPQTAAPQTAAAQAAAPQAVAPQPAVAEVPQAADPVCGMMVAAAAGSRQYEHAGTTWYFCSSGCRDTFAAAPGRFGA